MVIIHYILYNVIIIFKVKFTINMFIRGGRSGFKRRSIKDSYGK